MSQEVKWEFLNEIWEGYILIWFYVGSGQKTQLSNNLFDNKYRKITMEL